MQNLGVVFGGPSPEHDISILTGLQAARALSEHGVELTCLYWTRSGQWLKVPATLEAADFLEPDIAAGEDVTFSPNTGFSQKKRFRDSAIELDIVLNCCHGGPGEDGTLTAMLALAGIKVTGPNAQAAALAMDKYALSALAASVGVPTIDTVAVSTAIEPQNVAALPEKPWLVKPRFGGSSLGIETDIADYETAQALAKTGVNRSGALLQEMLSGWQDLNVSVRTFPQLQCSEIERPIRDGEKIYSYREKYLTGGLGMDAAPRELPADIPETIAQQIKTYALKVVEVAGLHGAPRVDFLWDGSDGLVLCELNSIPGAWANHLWNAAGVERSAFYLDLIKEASKRPAGVAQWASSTDGRALRSSGAIAAKLS